MLQGLTFFPGENAAKVALAIGILAAVAGLVIYVRHAMEKSQIGADIVHASDAYNATVLGFTGVGVVLVILAGISLSNDNSDNGKDKDKKGKRH